MQSRIAYNKNNIVILTLSGVARGGGDGSGPPGTFKGGGGRQNFTYIKKFGKGKNNSREKILMVGKIAHRL